jgi:type IV fimbrial biogenesis protein FimT
LVANQRVKRVASDLHITLLKARSEAIKRNGDVAISPHVPNNWQAGWHILNPSDPTLKIDDHGAISEISIIGPDQVVYQSSGRIKGDTIPSFDISASQASTHWCGTVDVSGRPYLKKAPSC